MLVNHSVSSTAAPARLSPHRLLLSFSSRVDRGALVAGLRMTSISRGVAVLAGVGVRRLVEASCGSVDDRIGTSVMAAAAASEQGVALLGAMLAWLMEGTALTSSLLAGVLHACLRTDGCLGLALTLMVFVSVSVLVSSGGSLTVAQSLGLQGRVT